MNKIQLGLIGYGYWGPNFARVISESATCALKFCADVSEKSLDRAKKKYPSLITTKDYRDILSDNDIKAVIIVTPTKTHYQVARECILAKKHVFIEKPLCHDVKEAEELIALAQDNNVKLMVGHVFLFNSAVKFIKDQIDHGHIGRLRHLHFQRRNLGPIRQDVNVLWDLSPHDISMALHFIGQRPLSVIASGESFLQKGIHDVVSASLKFPNNIMVNMIFSWIDPVKVRDIAIVGENKMILFDDVAQSERVKIFNKNANIIKNTLDVNFGEYQISMHSGDILVPAIDSKEPLKEEFNHFIDCVVGDKKPFTDGENGLEVVRIISAIQRSLDQNSTLVKL
ncbi:MAG TPA: hypothetical protein DCL35_02300 [Candidatus Omnitrophica bacterium]|nr:hypothetical protein [Candidatus Omnitrophota bacterium]